MATKYTDEERAAMRAERLRVRVWADEPPSNSGYAFIALRRYGNSGIHAALVSVSAFGTLNGWRWQANPTHWLPLLTLPGRKGSQ